MSHEYTLASAVGIGGVVPDAGGFGLQGSSDPWPGLLESVYEACLCVELGKRNIRYETQAPISIIYEGVRIDAGLRLDLLVEKSVILELKAVEKLLPVHQSQLLTYLKLADLRLGLLVNFNVAMFKQGVRRIIR